jgi:hypothetical protein
MKVREWFAADTKLRTIEVRMQHYDARFEGMVARYDAFMQGSVESGSPNIVASGFQTPIQALDALLEMEVPDGFE